MTSEKKRFYSGKGDLGTTTLFNKKRVKKNDDTLNLLGSIDELTAFIGLAISMLTHEQLKCDLRIIQTHLSKIMSKIARIPQEEIPFDGFQIYTQKLEEMIDTYGNDIDYPKEFSFPGETQSGAIIDVCRTISRRVERMAVGYIFNESHQKVDVISYLNRLSSLFFVLRVMSDESRD